MFCCISFCVNALSYTLALYILAFINPASDPFLTGLHPKAIIVLESGFFIVPSTAVLACNTPSTYSFISFPSYVPDILYTLFTSANSTNSVARHPTFFIYTCTYNCP